MTANSQAKLKLLRIMQMLQEDTDATQGLSMSDIIQRLNEQGIQAERKSVYRDLDLLRQFGLDVKTLQRNPVQYAIAKRDFSLAELKLLINIVQSCPFITQRQADGLVRSLRRLASSPQAGQLFRPIHVRNRIRHRNESVLENVDIAHKALAAKRQVTFSYPPHSDKEEADAGASNHRYVLTPVSVVYADNTYHLVCWSEANERFVGFRMDRMKDMGLSERVAACNDAIRHFSFGEWERSVSAEN